MDFLFIVLLCLTTTHGMFDCILHGKHHEGIFISERIPDFVLLFCIRGIFIVNFSANKACWLLGAFSYSVLFLSLDPVYFIELRL